MLWYFVLSEVSDMLVHSILQSYFEMNQKQDLAHGVYFLNRIGVYFCQIFNRFSIHPNSREAENFFLFRARKLALHSTDGTPGRLPAACQLVAIFACFIHEIRSCLSYSQIRFSECRRGISSPTETCRSTIEKQGITKIKKKKKISTLSRLFLFLDLSTRRLQIGYIAEYY